MIPKFPDTKRLELSDKPAIECFTKQFLPYSDFNFINMWSWDIENHVCVSNLDGNLVVRFADYATAEPFYMFIGNSSPDQTARQLLRQSTQEGLKPALKLIPRCVAERLDTGAFSVTEELDHMDYIVSTNGLRTYRGYEYSLQRNFVRRFSAIYPMVRFEVLSICDPNIQCRILGLFARWHESKYPRGNFEKEHEYVAFSRCVAHLDPHLIATGLFHEDTLIAVWLGEDVGNTYAISHFEKADTAAYVGVVPYLRQRTAELLLSRGIAFINLEQDLGIKGLRQSKRSYAPVEYFRKYSVSVRVDADPALRS